MDDRRLGDPGTKAFRLDKYPFYLLNRAVSRYNVVIEERLRVIEIDIPTWRVLMVLGERSPRSVGDLADKAVINLSTMMRIVQRMTRDGFVSLATRADDARVRLVSLTDFGNQKLDAARLITAGVYASIIDGFSETDFTLFITMLDRLNENLVNLTP